MGYNLPMFLENGKVRLHYEVSGSGKPLIMLHGSGEDMSIFSEALPLLEKHFTVYRIDSRCHGESTKKAPLHYDLIADDVYRFIVLLELDKPIVYGFSDGGIAALILAYTHPDSVSAIAVSGANTSPKTLKLLYRLGYMKLSVFTYDAKARMIATEPHITKEDLERIKVPALVMAGEKDMIKEEDTRFIASSIRTSRLLILPGESHNSYIIGSGKIADILVDNFTGENSLI